MVFKIRTSKKTMELFEDISASTSYAPFILSKLAIAMSIKSNVPLEEKDFKTDGFGLELNRQTITGEFDELFKSIIEVFEGKHLDDDEYFQKYLKAHLDRGARMLHSEYKYNSDFLIALIENRKTI